MSKDRNRIYTTGQAARICHLSQQTIIRCFDNGALDGFRIPGSKFRRIPHNALVKFMRGHNIPLDRLDGGKIRVLIVDESRDALLLADDLNADGRFEATCTDSGYGAGLLTEQILPDIMILDGTNKDINPNIICRSLRQNPRLAHIRVFFTPDTVGRDQSDSSVDAEIDKLVQKPYNSDLLIDAMLSMVEK